MTSRFYVTQDFDDELLETLPQLYEFIEKEQHRRNAEISIVINSYGGYVHVLKAFIHAINVAKKHDIVVETVVTGIAASCGSLLAIHGTPGHRLIAAGSQQGGPLAQPQPSGVVPLAS